MAKTLLKIAAVYIMLGVSLGVYMGATEDYTLVPIHVHFNLLGWATLGIIGLIYAQFPALAETKLAKAHFWLHNLGLPPLMFAVYLIYTGKPEIGGPLAGILSVVVWLGLLCFAVNLWRGLSAGK